MERGVLLRRIDTAGTEKDFPTSAVLGLPLFLETVSSPMATYNQMGLMAVDKSNESRLWFQYLIPKQCLGSLVI